MNKKIIMISEQDSVAVALCDLEPGEQIEVLDTELVLVDRIPFGHKVAVREIGQGEDVIKYGMPIGHARQVIVRGAHVHTHNLQTNLTGQLTYRYHGRKNQSQTGTALPKDAVPTFQGYMRQNGKVGIRNEIWIIPTVGCINQTALMLAEQARKDFGHLVDDIRAYPHNMGCSQLTEDHSRTQDILAGLINHPNAGAVLVLSLGCENNNLDNFMPKLGDYDQERIRFLVTQNVEDEHAAGMELLGELAEIVARQERQAVPVSELVIGFKCGGSDAFSGITANALCGKVNDQLIAAGAATILTEVSEMFGAETILMERTVNEEVFEKTVTLINGFKSYFQKYKQTIYENPSPGNKKGGVSTLEEKSLGCIQKGGLAPVAGVLDYGEAVQTHGLHLLSGPGNDPVSCTNLTASGAQMILFTTGRGNPYGAPVPTVKISSNSRLFKNKEHWIDYDAGVLLAGKSFEQAREELFSDLLALASGEKKAKNETNGYKEISVFRDGVIL